MSKETQISFPKHIFWHLCIQGWRFFILKLFSICLQTYTKLIYTGLLIKKALFRAILNHFLLFNHLVTSFWFFCPQFASWWVMTGQNLVTWSRGINSVFLNLQSGWSFKDSGQPVRCKGRSFHQNIQIAQIIQMVRDPVVDYQILFKWQQL